MRTVRQVVVWGSVLLLSGSVVVAQGTASPSWNLASDFRLAPDQSNPSPDRLGNPDVWSYMKSSSLAHDPGTYTLLHQFQSAVTGVQGLEGWMTFSECQSHDDLPAVRINATGQLQQDSWTWPAGVVSLHPCPGQFAIVCWRSPVNGFVHIKGSFIDLDANCGNGIAWSIDRGPATLAAGAFANGGSQDFELSAVPVTQGEILYFIVDPKGGDHICDSTGLDLTVSLAGAPGCDAPTTLCLDHNRFRVTANWTKNTGENGAANAVKLTDGSGYFWFFDPTNIEMIVKVLNGCGINNAYWVFAAGLTNVEVSWQALDTNTGIAYSQLNPQGTAFAPVQATNAFPTSCP